MLAVIAFNLTRAAATLTRQPRLAKATTATIRRTLIAVPARLAHSARRITLHLPAAWPWQQRVDRTVQPLLRATNRGHHLTTQPRTGATATSTVEHADSEVSRLSMPTRPAPPPPR